VVPVYDIGHFGDRPFFTMKLVKGHTLAALLAERADPTQDRPRFLGIALQVCQALAYAHAKGVIHRDLKPANVMVGAFGEVQVMDWGLAKVLAEGGIADEEKASRAHQVPQDETTIRTARSTGSGVGTDTEAGSLLGTPAYMPPEQANGDVANLDRRADVFGLGAILCEILTGKPPYVGRSAEEVRRKAANGDLADATARLDACGADAELIALTKGCLAAEASDRPRNAQAVADGLTAYLNGVQERLHQAELAEAEAKAKAIEEAKRRRLTLALAATVLLALTLGGCCFLYVKADRDARTAQTTRDVNEALNQVTALREKARTATTGGAALFAQAREHAQRALALVENGPAEAALKDQVQRLKAELDDEEKDHTLVAALDEARLAQAETVASENRFANERAVPLFREAFLAYGLPAGEGEPEAAAQRIRQRPAPVREAIVTALDVWDVLSGNTNLKIIEPHREWLRAVLDAADRDPWGRQVRAVRALKDPARRRAGLEKLAASADVATVPAQALTLLAQRLRPSQAVDLLRRAQQHRPADFWINHDLGKVLQEVTPPQYAEAVRFLTAAAALRPNSPGCLMNLGRALQDKGQVNEAIAFYQKVLALDPRYAAAHSNLGTALYDKGQVEEAIACFRQAIELDPKHAAAHSNLGNALHNKGQLDAAIASHRKAVAVAPKYAMAHNNLGNALKGKGKVEEAIACFRKALSLDPQLAVAYLALGKALKGKGQTDEAIACFRKAIQFDLRYALAHSNLGYALQDKGKVEEAIACHRKAIELDPKLASAHSNLGAALAGKGQVDEAIACCRKAVDLDPQSAAARNNLGNSLALKGRLDEAIACFRKAIDLEPRFVGGHYNLGIALYQKGQLDEAIACFRKAVEFEPKDARIPYDLGRALAARGHEDEAIASYRKALEVDPKHADAYRGLGALYCDRKGDYDAAIVCFQKAIALDPKNAPAHTNLGVALYSKGQLDQAIASYRKAIELDPKLAWAYSMLGVALAQKGRTDRAIACFQRAIALDPKLATAHANLGNALHGKGQLDQAIASFRKAIALGVKDARIHYNLGRALAERGHVDEAIVSYNKAIELDPKHATAHYHLGALFCDHKLDYDAAIASFRKAIALDPKDASNHFCLGLARYHKDQLDAAIASFQKAIELAPRFAYGHGALGIALLDRGRYAEARQATARALELLPEEDPHREETLQHLRTCRRLAKLEGRLPRLLKGEDKPASAQESLDVALMCQHKRLNAAAARFGADAYAADPSLAADLTLGRRSNAARCAALAAGQGEDAAKLDDRQRTRLRKQALDWLRADLDLRTRQLESRKAADRTAVLRTLRHWQKDADLAGIRDTMALAKLPAQEQKACTQLWADVAALLKKAQTPAKKEGKR
jgi:serine/threonine-protein kinase